MSLLPCVEIEPKGAAADAAVIWLHGLGADGHDFEPIVPELRLPATLAVRFVFPHAPTRPVTISGGMVMRAWYDILELNIDRHVDETQLLASAAAVAALIEREIARGIESRRIVIAGFSQGGAVAYQAAFSSARPLAGLLAISTYFATAQSIQPNPANAALPVLICHGTRDRVVPETLGHQAHQIVESMGHPVRYLTFPIEHSVDRAEIDAISAWLREVLAPA